MLLWLTKAEKLIIYYIYYNYIISNKLSKFNKFNKFNKLSKYVLNKDNINLMTNIKLLYIFSNINNNCIISYILYIV